MASTEYPRHEWWTVTGKFEPKKTRRICEQGNPEFESDGIKIYFPVKYEDLRINAWPHVLNLYFFVSSIPFPQGTDHIEGTNPNITKTWYPPISSCIAKSNSKALGDGPLTIGNDSPPRIMDNGDRRHNNNNNNYRNSNRNNNSSNRNRNNNNNNPYGVLNEQTEENFIQIEHNDVNDDDSHNIIEGAARSKVSRSSSAATETMGLNGSQTVHQTNSIIHRCLPYVIVYVLISKLFT